MLLVPLASSFVSGHCGQPTKTGNSWFLGDSGASCGSGGGGSVSSVTNSDSTLTISPTTGSVVASLALGHANTWSATQTFPNSSITNAELANSNTTVNGQTCTLGSTCTIPFQTNSVSNTSQAGVNHETSTVNAVGLTVTPTNPGTNVETFEVTGSSYTGNAATSTVAVNLSGTTTNSIPKQTGSATTGYIAPVNIAVVVTSAGGVPSESTTLPSALTIPSPTFTGAVGGSNVIPLSALDQIAQNTILGNSTGITGNVTVAYTVGNSGSDIPALTAGLLSSSILPKATSGAFGAGEGDGSTITLTAGVISCTTATASQIGCLKPDGTIVTISGGTITVPTATSSVLGVVKPDGTIITDIAGAITVAKAGTSAHLRGGRGRRINGNTGFWCD